MLLLVLAGCSGASRAVVVTREVKVTVVVTPTPPEGGVLVISADEQRARWSARIPDAYANVAPPFSLDDSQVIRQGQTLYMQHNCWMCHGPKGDGQGPFSSGLSPRPIDFTDAALMQRLSDAYLFWRLSEGGAQPPFLSAMPAWKSMLSEEERWQLIAYLRSLASGKAPAAGVSKQVGMELLQKYGCLGCHRYAGKGNFAGPDLDKVGARADADYIRESIINPSAKVVKGYRDIMPKDYKEKIPPEDLDAIVQFLAESK